MLNWVLALGATWLLARGFDQETTKAVVGSVALLISFGLAWWMNHGVTGDIAMAMIRRLLGVGAAYATFKGIISGQTADTMVTAIMTAVPVILSMWGYSTAAGPNLPGTTVVDAPTEDRTIWLEPKLPAKT